MNQWIIYDAYTNYEKMKELQVTKFAITKHLGNRRSELEYRLSGGAGEGEGEWKRLARPSLFPYLSPPFPSCLFLAIPTKPLPLSSGLRTFRKPRNINLMTFAN